MRTWTRAGALLVALGFVAPALAQAPPARPADRSAGQSAEGSWWEGWFGSGPKPVPKKSAEPAAKDSPARPDTVADRAREQERQRNAYFRRLGVCDRLKEIAHDTGNEALWAEAERLEEMARNLYDQHTRRSPSLLGSALLDDAPSRAALQADAPGGSPSSRPTPADPRATRNTSPREGQR